MALATLAKVETRKSFLEFKKLEMVALLTSLSQQNSSTER